MLGLRQRISCRQWFKILQILTVPSLYILEITMSVIKNLSKYRTNVSIIPKAWQKKNQLHLPSVRPSSIQNGVCYTSTRIFNTLPPHIVQLRENTMAFNNTLKIYHKKCILFVNYVIVFVIVILITWPPATPLHLIYAGGQVGQRGHSKSWAIMIFFMGKEMKINNWEQDFLYTVE